MPYSYSLAVRSDANAVVGAHLDAGAGPGLALVYDNSAGMPADADSPAVGVLLGTITLADPSGATDAPTGQFVFGTTTRDESADAAGTIGYVRLTDSAGTVVLDLPAQAGTDPVSGAAVFTTLSVVAGGPLELLSITIG